MRPDNHGDTGALDTSPDSDVAQVVRKTLVQTRYLDGWNEWYRHWCACGRAFQFFHAQGNLDFDKDGATEQAAVRGLVELLLREEREQEREMPEHLTEEQEHYIRVVGPLQLIYIAALTALPELEKAAQDDSTSVEGEFIATMCKMVSVLALIFEQRYPQYLLAPGQLPDFQIALMLIPCPYCQGSHPP